MDRQIVYPGSIPLDTDLLGAQRNAMVALGYLAQTILGTTTVVDGLACVPTSPASMSISVNGGSITQLGVIDSTPYGSLPALPANTLMRIGINTSPTTFALTSPTSPGQVTNYLVQASLLEQDTADTVLPYYNAANPAQPFSGPDNGGGLQATQRRQTVQLALKPGPAVAAGSQSVPAIDAGWVGLYVVAVAYGQTTITGSNISVLPNAPFLNWKMPQLTPGTQNLVVYKPTTQGTWIVPSGVSLIRVKMWGGGGAGGNGFGGAGGGGSGGGYSEGYYAVVPGQAFSVVVGNGGIGPSNTGEVTSFGSIASASGGIAGAPGASGVGGAGASVGGSGAGSGLTVPGSGGSDGVSVGSSWLSGAGGGSYGSQGALPMIGTTGNAVIGRNGTGPGCGGSGGIGAGVGGQGGAGLVLVEW